MESTIVGIQAVESKDINTSKGPGTLFLVKDVLGVEYSTFDKELAVQAAALKGHNATIGFELSTTVKPNRQGVDTTYTNRYLKSLSAAGEQAFDSTPPPYVPVASQGSTVASGASTSIIVSQPTQTDREEAIQRAVAIKAAVDSIVGLELNDWGSVTSLADYYRAWLNGEVPNTYVDDNSGAVAATAAPGLASDDIPF
jgi:hypothetical protein